MSDATMTQYCVWIVSPPDYPHSRCFEEIALSLSEGFKELGYECPIFKYPPLVGSTAIILGGNLLPYVEAYLPPHWIIYNLEQIRENSPWLTYHYIDLLKTQPVWDYSLSNISTLEKLGIMNVRHCEIGYVPKLTCIENSPNPDIDILFFGSVNDRRQEILSDLSSKCKVTVATNVYGLARDALIARSKIVLNLHFYESKVFELVRCSYLLANRKCIISETGEDKQLEEPFYEGISFSGYDGLGDRCLDLLGDNDARAELARKGFEIFSKRSQAEYLREVLC